MHTNHAIQITYTLKTAVGNILNYLITNLDNTNSISLSQIKEILAFSVVNVWQLNNNVSISNHLEEIGFNSAELRGLALVSMQSTNHRRAPAVSCFLFLFLFELQSLLSNYILTAETCSE